eukprot:680184-Rhodomonas_salina.1
MRSGGEESERARRRGLRAEGSGKRERERERACRRRKGGRRGGSGLVHCSEQGRESAGEERESVRANSSRARLGGVRAEGAAPASQRGGVKERGEEREKRGEREERERRDEREQEEERE